MSAQTPAPTATLAPMTDAQKSAALQTLTPEQIRVTQHKGTEAPFQNAYWDNHEDGIYVDVVSGEALFSSRDKFDSGSGWPSFTKPIRGSSLDRQQDTSHGMNRVEVTSTTSGSHLGHVFSDGPAEHGGERFCINSASLKFIPKAEMDAKGYGEFLYLFDEPAT